MKKEEKKHPSHPHDHEHDPKKSVPQPEKAAPLDDPGSGENLGNDPDNDGDDDSGGSDTPGQHPGNP